MTGQELIRSYDYETLRVSALLQMDQHTMDSLRQGVEDYRRGHAYRAIDIMNHVVICLPCVWGTHVGCLNGYYNNNRCSCTHE